MRSPTRREKIFSIILFITSLALSLVVFLVPIQPQSLAMLGYGGMFVITLLGAMTLFVSAPTMVAAFMIGSALNPLLVSVANETLFYVAPPEVFAKGGYENGACFLSPDSEERLVAAAHRLLKRASVQSRGRFSKFFGKCFNIFLMKMAKIS
jgi:hypothetical protein